MFHQISPFNRDLIIGRKGDDVLQCSMHKEETTRWMEGKVPIPKQMSYPWWLKNLEPQIKSYPCLQNA